MEGADRSGSKIDVSDPAELCRWAAHLHVTPDQLRAAVAAAGECADAVREHLDQSGERNEPAPDAHKPPDIVGAGAAFTSASREAASAGGGVGSGLEEMFDDAIAESDRGRSGRE